MTRRGGGGTRQTRLGPASVTAAWVFCHRRHRCCWSYRIPVRAPAALCRTQLRNGDSRAMGSTWEVMQPRRRFAHSFLQQSPKASMAWSVSSKPGPYLPPHPTPHLEAGAKFEDTAGGSLLYRSACWPEQPKYSNMTQVGDTGCNRQSQERQHPPLAW